MRLACRVLRVSPSAYYEWRTKYAHGPIAGDLDEAYPANAFMVIHNHLDNSCGSPRLTNVLAKRGFGANHKRVQRRVTTSATPPTRGARRRRRRFATAGPDRCPTACNGTSPSTHQVYTRVRTSPSSRRVRSCRFSPTSPTLVHADSSAAPWTRTCAPGSLIGLSPWRSTPGVATSPT